MVATIASVVLVVAWLVIDGELWDRPDGNSAEARDRSRLYNTSTLVYRKEDMLAPIPPGAKAPVMTSSHSDGGH